MCGGIIDPEDNGSQETVDEALLDTPLIDSAFVRSVAALSNHKPTPFCNAQYQFDEDRNAQMVVALQDIVSGEEIFCDYGGDYALTGPLAGKHNTLAATRPPPKWYREV